METKPNNIKLSKAMLGNKNGKNGGRPTDYNPKHCDKVFKLCLLGATDAEMADIIGVSEVTFNHWKKKHPEFLKSLKKGKADADANVAKSLYKRACGYSHPEEHISSYQGNITITETVKHYPPDTGAAFIWLKNRRPLNWRDKTEQEVTHSSTIDLEEINRELALAAKERERKQRELEESGKVGKYK